MIAAGKGHERVVNMLLRRWPIHCKGVYNRLLKAGQFPKSCAAYAMQTTSRAAFVAAGGRGA